ncbi:hypothetical protein AUJ95_00640 [Candidatus Desantisbacteria bacterium CG2_30_40_21]|uniref:DNA methylase N-4/N-6 domain-containing protein n=1 Tax=Candidatus Desantisbacteria bacterium CG2_30_40_21 TaxID=1817895 RepID=A0A1J5EL31_9BACT|nr:MAG: hypothetical protein AUJ95_00640 [Candidatus Desantisbacteria bacterium CG2_30_40_21]
MDNLNKKMMNTPDLNKERLEKLKELFPDLFTIEGNLNPDAADGNMIIEGENLEAMKVLLSAYRERVKCIYIDPPYNTGNDFVYSDRWDESKEDYWEHIGVTENGVKIDTNFESSGRYHSNWLNMMYSRLLLARQLLRDDGVIFISIDDNEVHHLRKMCDEVFGEENFVASYLWKKKGTTTNVEGAKVSSLTEYIICYKKSENDSLMYIQKKEAMYLAMVHGKNIFDEVLLKNGLMLNYSLEQIGSFMDNKVFFAKDDLKECLVCMNMSIEKKTLKELENYKDKIFICLERSLNTTMKWNLRHLLGDKLIAF